MALYYNYNISAGDVMSVDCAVCHQSDSRTLGVDNGFTICKCANPECGFVYVNPRPTPERLAELYRSYYPDAEEVPEKWQREMGDVFRESCDWLTSWQAAGTVLDVGCAYGHFLQAMEARGWRTVGLEPNPTAVRYAERHVAGRIIGANFEEASLDPESFDAVASFYVLEHVIDPRQFLDKVCRVLRPGGMAVIRVPYTEPLFPINKMAGRTLMYAPMHLNDFSPRSMRRLALDVGFRRTEVRVGASRRSHEIVEQVGARVLGGIGRLVEYLARGRVLFPYVGALSYRLWK